MKRIAGRGIFVFLLSLATWLFFYYLHMPLEPTEVAGAVGLWVVVVTVVDWVLRRLRSWCTRLTQASSEPPDRKAES